MINTNINRWQSVRLLFDKHIIGGNLKSNYQWQRSAAGEEQAEPLQGDEAAGVVGATLTRSFHLSLMGYLKREFGLCEVGLYEVLTDNQCISYSRWWLGCPQCGEAGMSIDRKQCNIQL